MGRREGKKIRSEHKGHKGTKALRTRRAGFLGVASVVCVMGRESILIACDLTEGDLTAKGAKGREDELDSRFRGNDAGGGVLLYSYYSNREKQKRIFQ